jgi:hypothetical protein
MSNGKHSAPKVDSTDGTPALQPTPTKQKPITHYFQEPKPEKIAEQDSETKKQSTSTADTTKRKKASGKENKAKSSSGLDGFVSKKSKPDVIEQKE